MSHSKDDKNFLLDLMVAGDRELSDFLQTRPNNEELGESLDFFKQHLMEKGELTEKRMKEIQSCHIHYLSRLLSSDLPIKTVSNINIREDDKIASFCEDCDYLYNADLNETHIRGFADAYQSVDSLFVNYNMAKILLRYHIIDKALEYYEKALKTALFSIDDFWNNKESVYACSELLFEIVYSEQFNTSAVESKLMGKLLEYAYLILSRAVLWPDDSDERLLNFDIPISYRHKISCLNKRAEVLLKHKSYFNGRTPSFSTAETLAIADYSLSHDFAFMGQKIGLKSLFKRDAKNLYDNISNQDLRPFSTAIIDGKKDAVELAHRFYLKSQKNKYLLDECEYLFVSQLLAQVVNEKHIPIPKVDEKLIRQYLLDNGITHFYHFTERENIENIKKNGGICSLKYCLINGIEVSTKGDMTLLRDADAFLELEDYARLSFCYRHPLIKKRQEAGADLVLLKIKIDVAWRYGTLFSDRDAALPYNQRGQSIEDLKKVRMEAIRKSNLEEWDPDYEFNQAEVMVKSIIPIEYIENIDNPIVISMPSSPERIEITYESMERAIHTIIILSGLFQSSSFLLSAKDGRNEKKKLTMYSFAGILGYLFEEEYCFGDFSDLVDMEIQLHYFATRITLSDTENKAKAISDLANNWSDILQTILEIQTSDADDSKDFIELQPEIDHVTRIIEEISGKKCRKPTIGYAKTPDPRRSQFNRDAFTQMVEEAAYNPFRITAKPELQKFPPFPDSVDRFRIDLLSIYNNSSSDRSSEMQIFISYVVNIIESYYENEGYVPKNTVDAIVEQCDQAIKGTLFAWHLPTLDEKKYKVYLCLFSRQGIEDSRLYQRYGFLM
jgi:hypothetical protein